MKGKYEVMLRVLRYEARVLRQTHLGPLLQDCHDTIEELLKEREEFARHSFLANEELAKMMAERAYWGA